MPATSEPSPMGQFFEEQFKQAWKFFDKGAYDEGKELSRWLLSKPAISDLHKAGLYLILAHSLDEYVFHTKEAVRMYESLYDNGEAEMTKNQKKSRDTLFAGAKRILRQCEADKAEIKIHNRTFTQEDLQGDIDHALEEDFLDQEKQEEELEAAEEEAAKEEDGDAAGKDTEMGGTAEERELEPEHEDSTPLLPTPPKSRGNA